MPYPTIEDYPYLQLDIDGKSVKLNQFTSYTRKRLHGAKIDYAFSGNDIVKRSPHESKHLWIVTVLIDSETRNKFELITELADKKIFTPPFDSYRLILSDVCLSKVESTISRPKADPFEAVGIIGDIEYFAKFWVTIDLSSIEGQPNGQWFQLSFIINESKKLTI